MTPLASWLIGAFCLLTLALAGGLAWLYQKLREAHRELHALRMADAAAAASLTRLSRWACTGRAIDRRVPEFERLKCWSQHGEELLAWDLLGERAAGFYVDIGAYDGIRLSNTAFFEGLGWTGILVEAHPELVAECRKNRPGSEVVHAAIGDGTAGATLTFSMVRGKAGVDTLSFAGLSEADQGRIRREGGAIETVEVPATTLAKLLDDRGPVEIDLLSIDVEGAELSVLKGAALDRHRPRLIVIEDNSDGRDRRVAEFLTVHGYRKAARLGCNDFFLRAGHAAARQQSDRVTEQSR